MAGKSETGELVTVVKGDRRTMVKPMHVPAWEMMGYKVEQDANKPGSEPAGTEETL